MEFHFCKNSKNRTINNLPTDISTYRNMRYDSNILLNVQCLIAQLNLLFTMLPKLISSHNGEATIRNILIRQELSTLISMEFSHHKPDNLFLMKMDKVNPILSSRVSLYSQILSYCYHENTRFCSHTIGNIYKLILSGVYKKSKNRNISWNSHKSELNHDLVVQKKHVEKLLFDLENFWYVESCENIFVKISLIYSYLYIINPFQDNVDVMTSIINILLMKGGVSHTLPLPLNLIHFLHKEKDKMKTELKKIVQHNNYAQFFDFYLQMTQSGLENIIGLIKEFIFAYQTLEKEIIISEDKYKKQHQIIIDHLWTNETSNYNQICGILNLAVGTTKKILKDLINKNILGYRLINKKEKVFFLKALFTLSNFFN